MKVSVVIPAYNEQATIRDCVLEVLRYFPGGEVIVVNNKSDDQTLRILLQIQAKYKNLRILTNKENRGHGFSVVRGIRASTGDYVFYIDADQQIDIKNFRVYEGYDFISGYRVGRHDKLFRKFISFGLKMTNLLWHGKIIRDANCPFKIYRGDAVRDLLKYAPLTNIVPIACLEVIARKYGFKCLEIPVLHHPYFTVRKGTLQTLNKKSIKFFYDAWKEVKSL